MTSSSSRHLTRTKKEKHVHFIVQQPAKWELSTKSVLRCIYTGRVFAAFFALVLTPRRRDFLESIVSLDTFYIERVFRRASCEFRVWQGRDHQIFSVVHKIRRVHFDLYSHGSVNIGHCQLCMLSISEHFRAYIVIAMLLFYPACFSPVIR